MIRVDLGKDEVQRKKSPLARLLGGLGSKKKKGAPKALPAKGSKLRGVSKSIKGWVVLIVALGVAIVPQLLLEEYKKFVVETTEAQKAKLQEQLKALNQEITKRAPLERELKSYEAQKELVKGKIDVVRQLLAARGTPVNVMDAVSQSLPKEVWLDGLEFNGNQGRANLKISGRALNNENISDYVDRLSESVHISDVALTRVGTNRQNNIDVKSFELSAKPKVTFPSGKAGSQ